MRRVQLLFGVLGAALAAFAAYSADGAELPDGPNRALVAAQCGACHDLQPLFDAAAAGVNRDDWNAAIDEMTSYGLKVTPDQRFNERMPGWNSSLPCDVHQQRSRAAHLFFQQPRSCILRVRFK